MSCDIFTYKNNVASKPFVKSNNFIMNEKNNLCKSVSNIFENHISDHHHVSSAGISQKTVKDITPISNADSNQNTPKDQNIEKEAKLLFNNSVYDNLPPILLPLIDLYQKDDAKRDVALISLLTHLSACCHFVHGVYHDRDCYPNLISMQIGAAASGKGEALWAKQIIESVDEVFMDPKNNMKKFIISGNTSRAMLISRLQANEGVGIISESEGDTIAENYKSEWGNLSSILRCAYQNESISSERKGSNEITYIKNPRFSMNVTMTPKQLKSLVNERENGLYSRVLFYNLPGGSEFTSPKPKTGVNSKNLACKAIASEVKKWYTLLRSNDLSFELNDNQWLLFTQFWKERHENLKSQSEVNNDDIIFRIALSSFKIAMVLSAIRLKEIPSTGIVKCLDKDLNSALSLSDTLLHHSINTSNLLMQFNTIPVIHSEFLRSLPNEFSSKEFIELASSFQISERTSRRKLNLLTENNYLTKTKHGQYKINKNDK